MGRENQTKRSVLSLFLAFLLVLSTQMQIAAPAAGAKAKAQQNSAVQAASYAENGNDNQEERYYNSPDDLSDRFGSAEDGTAMPGSGSALEPDDILPDENETPIQPPEPEPASSSEAQGASVIPVQTNNIIRDSLPSLISTKIYTFSVDSRGVIIYAFNHTVQSTANCVWHITLYEEYSPDGSGNTTAYRELNCQTYEKIGEGTSSPSIGVLPGNYRLTVECVTGYTSEKYDLAIGFAGSDTYETECNDTQSRYTYLPLDITFSGSASVFSDGTLDEDWYMAEVTDTGYAVFYFEHEADADAASESVAWRIRILDAQGNEYLNLSDTTGKTSLNSGVMGLQPGCYFIQVTAHVRSSVTYSLNLSFTADKAIERELNETPETATPLGINTEMIGSLTARDAFSDRDYFSFTMEKAGFLVLDFLHEALSEQHDGWNISLLSENGTVLYKTVSDWTQAALQSPSIGLSAGKYFIRIDSDNIYRSSIVYRLILLTVEDSAWESEPNNSPAAANKLTLGKAMNGTLIENGVTYDSDYFTFTLDKAAAVDISFGHILTQESGKEGWLISLTDKDGNRIASETSAWDEGEKTFRAQIEPGQYYIVIETGLFFNSAQYVLTVQSVS